MSPLFKFTLGFVIGLISFNVSAQNYADKEYYLIDSLVLEDLSTYDRELLDSSLVIYHNTTDDTLELEILEHIVDNCWDPEVWPKYNRFLINTISEMLTINMDETSKKKHWNYLAGAVSNLGFYYDENGDLVKALDYYHEALKLYESAGSDGGAATTLNNLGVMYSVIGDTARALEYHRESLERKKKIGDIQGVAMSYNNIGTIHENMNDNFGALEFYEASLKLREQINDRRGAAIAYDNIGDIYYKEGVYAKAQTYYDKSYEIWVDLEIYTGITTSLNNLSKLNFKLGNYELAREYGEKSFQIAREHGYLVDIENSSRTLIDIYQHSREFEKALEFSLIFIDARDRLRGNKSAQIALQKSMKYQYDKLALQDSLRHLKEKEIKDAEIDSKQTQAYALYIGLGMLIIILILGIRSFQQKQKDNKMIELQKFEVERQKEEIEQQHVKLAESHQEISDSISYAKRIQDAILPSTQSLKASLKDGFVMYMPKDVVSGDFYWLNETAGKTFLAVADCTGHGVPGAMVSVVCHNALNRAVREFDLVEPAAILNKTREIIVDTLKASEKNVKDGMDISICCLDPNSLKLEWAGANNPLYFLKSQDSEITTILPDKQPVGKFEMSKPFTNHEIQLEKGDIIYLFTDGYMDQFGGEKGKKYKYARFREKLVKIRYEQMDQQGKSLESEIINWMGNYEQIDDICVVGIRV